MSLSKKIAIEIYLACMELPEAVDPTLPECEFLARKIMAVIEREMGNNPNLHKSIH